LTGNKDEDRIIRELSEEIARLRESELEYQGQIAQHLKTIQVSSF